jgi:large subunit ribosomal protein L35
MLCPICCPPSKSLRTLTLVSGGSQSLLATLWNLSSARRCPDSTYRPSHLDVPVLEQDSFTYRCHLVASNIPLSPTKTSIPLQRIAQEDAKADASAKKIALPWISPWAHKGAPYHRLAIFVLEQKDAQALDVAKLSATKREKFNLRSFVDKHKLNPITATLFRTQWDESMAGVMERAGVKDQIAIELKRRRVEPLPYKRRTERMR